jgi:tetratricopeptide (TPR) repeat protein
LEKSISTDTISSGLNAYNAGLKYDAESKHQEAVDSFTRAIKYGYTDIQIFLLRGGILQILNRHKLAIRDFQKVILHRPDDCYPLFLISLSKYKVDDFTGAILDIKKAIILSRADTEINFEYWNLACKLGWNSHTDLYQAYLNNYTKSLD